jgi:chemotaxis protein MotB
VKTPARKKEECPDWIISFTDMTSLEMSFFIVLMSFSTPSREKLDEVRGSIQSAFGFFGSWQNKEESNAPTPLQQGREEVNLNAPRSVSPFVPIQDHDPNDDILRLRDENGETIEFNRITEGYRVSMSGAVMFPAMSDQMTIESFERLAKVARAVSDTSFGMTLVGYVSEEEAKTLATGDRSLDLSLRRAVATALRLNRECGIAPSRLSVAGYSPTGAAELPGRVDMILSKPQAFKRVGEP